MNRNERRHRKQVTPRRRLQPVRRRMALWEWLVLVSLLIFGGVIVFLRLTGRPGPTVPNWVDQPPYYPTR